MARLQKIKIAWNNPFTNPPNNQPRTVFETLIDASTVNYKDLPDFQKALKQHGGLGSGYGVQIDFVDEPKNPKRKWTQERKAKTRRRNLRTRIQRKLKFNEQHQIPMFENPVEVEFNKQVESNPDYFDGGDEHKKVLQEREKARRQAQERLREKYTNQLNQKGQE